MYLTILKQFLNKYNTNKLAECLYNISSNLSNFEKTEGNLVVKVMFITFVS